ncbi:UxaA family hydrolase [Phytoactinopolyspora halophila]|uniref:UxaA family hydrolase n=1 Tax=Phytoactinopolyspora halophila TaxID=1981511 RepID=UPI0013141C79|nr:UxaA family hydrolase [Phytoactinopolyspora halophila]
MRDIALYRRQDGRAGSRNQLLIIAPEVLANSVARRIAGAVADAVLVVEPAGRALVDVDRETTLRTLTGLAAHPNVGAVLIVAYDAALAEHMAAAARDVGTPAAVLDMVECGSTIEATSAGIRLSTQLAIEASERIREPAEPRDLIVGLKCGLSDGLSGLVLNPVVGRVVDKLVDRGARCMFGESAEIWGAEHILARRARSDVLGKKMVATVRERHDRSSSADMETAVVGPENRSGGITTLTEKALGNVAKTGSAPIDGLLNYAEAPPKPGLYFMDTPVAAAEATTGLVAGGAHALLFTTGVGNPFGHLVAPTVKVGWSDESTVARRDHLDVDLGPVVAGEESLECAADRVLEALLRVAGGRLTRAEVIKEGGYAVAREAPSV